MNKYCVLLYKKVSEQNASGMHKRTQINEVTQHVQSCLKHQKLLYAEMKENKAIHDTGKQVRTRKGIRLLNNAARDVYRAVGDGKRKGI